jgi:hypothetical protein
MGALRSLHPESPLLILGALVSPVDLPHRFLSVADAEEAGMRMSTGSGAASPCGGSIRGLECAREASSVSTTATRCRKPSGCNPTPAQHPSADFSGARRDRFRGLAELGGDHRVPHRWAVRVQLRPFGGRHDSCVGHHGITLRGESPCSTDCQGGRPGGQTVPYHSCAGSRFSHFAHKIACLPLPRVPGYSIPVPSAVRK